MRNHLDRVKRMAYFTWRKLPPQFDLDDITSEAVLGALQAREGCEIIASKRAVIQYLRRCNPGSRGTGSLCLKTIYWAPNSGKSPERIVIENETRARLLRAVDTLTAKQLAVLRAVYWDDLPQGKAARILGTDESYFSRTKTKALGFLRAELSK